MPSPASLRVLVVDDQESMRRIVFNLLRQLGVTLIVEAGSKAEAQAHLTKQKFHLILSDYNMDNGSGLDLLNAVRASPLTKNTPFIMITGNADAETVTAVMKAGVNNYLVKPVSLLTLKKRLEQVLGPLK